MVVGTGGLRRAQIATPVQSEELMTRRPLSVWAVRAQGSYYIFTGAWPLVHYASFAAVTGPKVDVWMVKMVGLLAVSIGLSLRLGVLRGVLSLEAVVLALAAALSFASVDLYYVLVGRIGEIYIVDAALELGFFAALVGSIARRWRR